MALDQLCPDRRGRPLRAHRTVPRNLGAVPRPVLRDDRGPGQQQCVAGLDRLARTCARHGPPVRLRHPRSWVGCSPRSPARVGSPASRSATSGSATASRSRRPSARPIGSSARTWTRNSAWSSPSSRSTDNSSQTGRLQAHPAGRTHGHPLHPGRRADRVDADCRAAASGPMAPASPTPGTPTAEPSRAPTAAEYVVPISKAGKRIRVKVTGTLADHPTLSRTSASSARVMRWTRPLVTGTPAVGTTLRARRGTWTGKASFHYQWLRDGAPVPAATRTTYRAHH